jgi:hypothetical protein
MIAWLHGCMKEMLPRINLLYALRVGNRDDQKNSVNSSDQMLNVEF